MEWRKSSREQAPSPRRPPCEGFPCHGRQNLHQFLCLCPKFHRRRNGRQRVVRRTVRLSSHLQALQPRAESNRLTAARGSVPCGPFRPRLPAGATGRATRSVLGPTPDPSRYAHRQPFPHATGRRRPTEPRPNGRSG